MRSHRWMAVLPLALTLQGCALIDALLGPEPVPPPPPPIQSTYDTSPVVAGEALPIGGLAQNTPVWCWLASGEMVHRYYGQPNVNPFGNYQCGMVGILYPATCGFNCGNCISGASSWSMVNDMIVRYPQEILRLTPYAATPMRSSSSNASLTWDQVKAQIDNGWPVLTAVNPSGFRITNQISEHVAVIVGYEVTQAGTRRLIVNDPWPYELNQWQGQPDPYLQAGGREVRPFQYHVPYDGFRQRLQWGQTIHSIRPASAMLAAESPYQRFRAGHGLAALAE